MAINDFDRIAPFYRRISRLIFGDHLVNAQIRFLEEVKPEDEVLILGGGTGELLKYFPNCSKIHFVEMSHEMIKRASKHNTKGEIKFIEIDFLNFEASNKYDLIICPFFLDCFNEMNLNHVLTKIKSMLKPDANLLVTDFKRTRSNSSTLRLMHFFFRFVANLEAKKLLDINGIVISKGFVLVKEKISHRNQLFSRLYRNL